MTSVSKSLFGPRLGRINVALILVISLYALLFHSTRAAVSLAVGGAISTVNFHWLRHAVDFVVLRGAYGRVGKRVAVQYAGRYALIGLTLYVTIRFSVLDPVLVIAGLLTYVFAVLLEAVFEIAKSLARDRRNGRASTSDRQVGE